MCIRDRFRLGRDPGERDRPRRKRRRGLLRLPSLRERSGRRERFHTKERSNGGQRKPKDSGSLLLRCPVLSLFSLAPSVPYPICYAGPMASYLDSVPFSGIIRIRDMMYSVADPFRLDQGDVSFDAPDTVKSAMTRAIAENKSHYLQTTGVPRLRELIAEKLRTRNAIPVDDPEDVRVTNGGIHGLYIICQG